MNIKKSEIKKLSEKLAREIFKIGDEPKSPCNRIQFKGGKWPDNERNQGGISEGALAIRIQIDLERIAGV